MEYRVTRVEDSNELMHYGVLGMKWGVHRTKRYLNTATKAINKQQSLQADRLEKARNAGDRVSKMSRQENRLYNKYKTSMAKAEKQAAKNNDQFKKYQEKEHKKIDKKYGISVKEKRAIKSIEDYRKMVDSQAPDKKVAKMRDKAINDLAEIGASKALSDMEKTNFSKKTLNEIHKDKIASGRDYITNFLLYPAAAGIYRHELYKSELNGVNQDTINKVYNTAHDEAVKRLKR